uniref:RRM domain-containing protein n=1 Tax=Leersia perrieri TaxID=77586 RepID=A0A0D9XN12_9ORYZ
MAAASLDMALDDLITTNRRRRRAPSSSSPMARRSHSRAAAAPYHAAITCFQAPPPVAYGYGNGTQPTNVDTPTKLYISNLDYAVSNEDIKELFSELGNIKRYSINYDKSGRSKGTAEVVFSTRSDALAAVKKYNNVHLDGKPMKIELIGTNIQTPAPLPLPPPAIFGFTAPAAYFTSPTKSGAGRGGRGWAQGRGGRGWAQGRGGFGGRGRGHMGRGRGKRYLGSRKVSAEELDADLDKYHAEGMQIS